MAIHSEFKLSVCSLPVCSKQTESQDFLSQAAPDIIGYIGANYLTPSENVRLLTTCKAISRCRPYIENYLLMNFNAAINQVFADLEKGHKTSEEFADLEKGCKTPEEKESLATEKESLATEKESLAKARKEIFDAIYKGQKYKINSILCQLFTEISGKKLNAIEGYLNNSIGISLEHVGDAPEVLSLSKKIRISLQYFNEKNRETLKKILPALIEHQLSSEIIKAMSKFYFQKVDLNKICCKIFARIPQMLIMEGHIDEAIEMIKLVETWYDNNTTKVLSRMFDMKDLYIHQGKVSPAAFTVIAKGITANISMDQINKIVSSILDDDFKDQFKKHTVCQLVSCGRISDAVAMYDTISDKTRNHLFKALQLLWRGCYDKSNASQLSGEEIKKICLFRRSIGNEDCVISWFLWHMVKVFAKQGRFSEAIKATEYESDLYDRGDALVVILKKGMAIGNISIAEINEIFRVNWYYRERDEYSSLKCRVNQFVEKKRVNQSVELDSFLDAREVALTIKWGKHKKY
jgi:hypothetical protein